MRDVLKREARVSVTVFEPDLREEDPWCQLMKHAAQPDCLENWIAGSRLTEKSD
jgi:hypothetical protein